MAEVARIRILVCEHSLLGRERLKRIVEARLTSSSEALIQAIRTIAAWRLLSRPGDSRAVPA